MSPIGLRSDWWGSVKYCIEDIQSGSSITVQYTRDLLYFDGPCGCVSCRSDHPPNINGHPVASGSRVKESQPGGKRKWHRAGKRMCKIRKRESDALDRVLEELNRRLDALDREIEELGSD